ncbi:hypothetical protein C8Q74DRAFT_742569 [Fomes fomentarius]|nr:hypothetical protein C8Q74DRAFT_742569 [Fomes fomentarius]
MRSRGRIIEHSSSAPPCLRHYAKVAKKESSYTQLGRPYAPRSGQRLSYLATKSVFSTQGRGAVYKRATRHCGSPRYTVAVCAQWSLRPDVRGHAVKYAMHQSRPGGPTVSGDAVVLRRPITSFLAFVTQQTQHIELSWMTETSQNVPQITTRRRHSEALVIQAETLDRSRADRPTDAPLSVAGSLALQRSRVECACRVAFLSLHSMHARRWLESGEFQLDQRKFAQQMVHRRP